MKKQITSAAITKISDSVSIDATPLPPQKPQFFLLQHDLAEQFAFNDCKQQTLSLLTGEAVNGLQPKALAYAGHQFGYFNPSLGDGRAHLLGDIENQSRSRFELQLKGSGPTRFSRGGDGLSTLGSALREYIYSNALHELNIPTTRTLSVMLTGAGVYRNQVERGAVSSRIAKTHLRIGTFEYFACRKELNTLAKLVDFAISRCNIEPNIHPVIDLLEWVIQKQCYLVAQWQRVGFIHGVMNTDNTTIAGETIDFGPCAMLGAYRPQACFSSIDQNSRYAFNNQPNIIQWNLLRFAESLLLLIEDNKALTEQLTLLVQSLPSVMSDHLDLMQANKLGFINACSKTKNLTRQWYAWLESNAVDFTAAHALLLLAVENKALPLAFHQDKTLTAFLLSWRQLLKDKQLSQAQVKKLLLQHNPHFVLRNKLVEQSITEAVAKCAAKPVLTYLERCFSSDAFSDWDNISIFEQFDQHYQTFCGT